MNIGLSLLSSINTDVLRLGAAPVVALKKVESARRPEGLLLSSSAKLPEYQKDT